MVVLVVRESWDGFPVIGSTEDAGPLLRRDADWDGLCVRVLPGVPSNGDSEAVVG